MRISDWSSDVCSSDLAGTAGTVRQSAQSHAPGGGGHAAAQNPAGRGKAAGAAPAGAAPGDGQPDAAELLSRLDECEARIAALESALAAAPRRAGTGPRRRRSD